MPKVDHPFAKESGEDFRWKIYRSNVGDYLHRWIVLVPWFAVRLHKFLRSDAAEALHDHPFSFVSFILWGEYWEHLVDGTVKHRKWLSIAFRQAEVLHRVELRNFNEQRKIKPVWTLVLTGPKRRRWGFVPAVGGAWVYWCQAKEMWQ